MARNVKSAAFTELEGARLKAASKQSKANFKQVNVSVPENMFMQLHQVALQRKAAKQANASVMGVIRDAVEAYLSNQIESLSQVRDG
jgi:hypothetical protein